MKKVVCIHLFNDFSGSPLVLSTAIKGFRKNNIPVDLITCGGREGFLSHLDVVERHFFYRWLPNKYLRLVVFMLSQLQIFLMLLRYWRQDVVIYINTLLPFGAALAGKLMGKRVVYHVHETSVNPPSLKSFLKGMAKKCATEGIYVSKYLQEAEGLEGVPGHVIYNALSEEFVAKAQQYLMDCKKVESLNVLMLCSLKDYKGVREFVRLAEVVPAANFELVLNADHQSIEAYFAGQSLPENLILFPVQSNVHPFYQRADLVLNLSHPEQWVETFGMTLLEAMLYGVPSIVPPVGGPVEVVQDGLNGYQIDQRELKRIAEHIQNLIDQPELLFELSENSRRHVKQFSVKNMVNEIHKVALKAA
ncbi:MAG: glycosyltransferase family 4 protein [Bacteroidota bacterium]